MSDLLFPDSERGPLKPWQKGEPHDEQSTNLKRVGGAIGDDVLAYCRARVGQTFLGEHLREHIAQRGHRAPDSGGRILRLLRQHEWIDYEVVSRKDSLYRVLRVAE